MSLNSRWHRLPPYLLVSIASAMTALQCILAFIFHDPHSPFFEWAGWVCLWSAAIFGMLPIRTFRRHGDVPEGKSYIQTTRLVTSGIYSIVRHPQNGTAWILINLGVMLIIRHWTSTITGGLSILLAYFDTYQADLRCIEKFGNAYRQYITQVPRVNFLCGVYRIINKKIRR